MPSNAPVHLSHLSRATGERLLAQWEYALQEALDLFDPGNFTLWQDTTNNAGSDVDFTVNHREIGSVAAVEPCGFDSPESADPSQWGVYVFGRNAASGEGLSIPATAKWLHELVRHQLALRAARDAASRLGGPVVL